MKLKKAKDNKKFLMTILSLSVAAVMFVPVLYSFIYLNSIWDVYGRLDNVPVAFVNRDKSVTKDGKEYAVGRELEDSLKDNKKVAWKFVSYEEAKEGVEGTKYYALIEVPEDFSEKIAETQDGSFNNPEIIYIGNKGRNFVFSQLSSKIAESIKAEVSSNIQKEISKALVDSLYDVKVSIKDAGDGAFELQNGTEKLLDGSKDLAEGAKKAEDGSSQLEIGLKQAAAAAGKLVDGTSKLLTGSKDLSKGLDDAARGSEQLVAGLNNIKDGQGQIADGASALVEGLNTFKSSLTKSNDQLPLLVQGASGVNKNTELIEKGAEQLNTSLNTGLNALADGINQTASGINQAATVMNAEVDSIKNSNMGAEDKAKLIAAIGAINKINSSDLNTSIEAPLRKAAGSVEPLVSSLKQLNEGTKKVSDGTLQLAGGLADTQSKAAAGADKLIEGAKGIQQGSSSILEGLNTVTSKTDELSKGLDKLSGGSASLKDGLQAVDGGTASLKAGLNTAAAKTGELSKGLVSLSSGSTSLKDGLEEANDGAIKLSDGLKDGYDKISNNLKFDSEKMSQFVSEPVTLKDNSINKVNYYGEGLAPYFISLSLWLGAMFISIILSISKSLKVFNGKFMNSFIGKLTAGSALVALQAVILSAVLIKGVNINPVSVSEFYLSNIFIAVTFFSVMYGISHAIGVLGAPIMFVVLILQLSSSAGTFPIETAPAFYRVVGRFVPMTYSVNILRMIISGINSSVLSHNIGVMLIFITVFLCGGFIIKAIFNLIKGKSQAITDSQAA